MVSENEGVIDELSETDKDFATETVLVNGGVTESVTD
jgi:hypothetical protein